MSRTDKYYLGGGDQLMFAPAHPLFLDTPGFWDALTFDYSSIPQSFALAFFVGRISRAPLRLVLEQRKHQPHELLSCYDAFDVNGSSVLRIEERRGISPDNRAISQLTLINKGSVDIPLRIAQWGMLDAHSDDVSYAHDGQRLELRATFTGRRAHQRTVRFSIGGDEPCDGLMLRQGEKGARAPRWEYTPFFEDGFVADAPTGTTIVGLKGSLFYQRHIAVDLPASGNVVVTFFADFEPNIPEDVRPQRTTALKRPKTAEENWRHFMAGVPEFRCSDKHLEHYWRYRFQSLKLLLNPGSIGNHRYPGVAEGIGFFRTLISYSTQAIVRDLRWHKDQELAKGCLRNFFANQLPNGCFPGRIYQDTLENADFYHANWGDAVMAVYETSGDKTFLAEAYEALSRYAHYFTEHRDHDGSGLYDIWNHFETGQEFSSRYAAVNPKADMDEWEDNLVMKGVDVTVYMYRTLQALSEMAEILGKDPQVWAILAQKTATAMHKRMWSDRDGYFSDLDQQGQRTGVASFTNFYPYITDLAGPEHVQALREHLLNPEEFWTPYPVATLSQKDPLFSAGGYWKNKRRSCPWNGRVWPMTNSHAVEILATQAERCDASLAAPLERLLFRFIHMMCFNKDPARPNCFEHYNPMTGEACIYRGIDDYAHSWVADLIVKYVVGFRPKADGSYEIKPLVGKHLEWSMKGLRVREKMLHLHKPMGSFDVRREGSRGT